MSELSNGRSGFLNPLQKFYLTLIGAVSVVVLALFNWASIEILSSKFSFNLFGLWRSLDGVDPAFIATQEFAIINAAITIIAILLLFSVALLILSLIKHQSKQRATFAFWGFGLAALAFLIFIVTMLGINGGVRGSPKIISGGIAGSGLTIIPFIGFAFSAIALGLVVTTSELQSALQSIKQYSMLFALIAVIGFFMISSGGKLIAPMNITNIIFQNAHIIILAIGMLICILTGGNIDLSVGSVVAVICALAGRLIVVQKMDVYLAMAICLLAGLLIGAWQGFWIAYVRIPAFIVTLSGMLVFRGLTINILGGQTISPFPDTFKQLFTGFLPDLLGRTHIQIPQILGIHINLDVTVNGLSLIAGWVVAALYIAAQLYSYFNKRRKGYATGSVRALAIRLAMVGVVTVVLFTVMGIYANEKMPAGVPTVLVSAGILLVLYAFFTNNTVMGRHIYALGGNEKAARLSGVKTNGLLFFAYVNMAVLASVAGLVLAARMNSAIPQAGERFELDAISACFIGGASAYGGIGTIGGTLIGALLIGVLNNGMSLTGIAMDIQMVVKGLVLLAAVAFDVISKKQTALPAFRLPYRRKAKAESTAL